MEISLEKSDDFVHTNNIVEGDVIDPDETDDHDFGYLEGDDLIIIICH